MRDGEGLCACPTVRYAPNGNVLKTHGEHLGMYPHRKWQLISLAKAENRMLNQCSVAEIQRDGEELPRDTESDGSITARGKRQEEMAVRKSGLKLLKPSWDSTKMKVARDALPIRFRLMRPLELQIVRQFQTAHYYSFLSDGRQSGKNCELSMRKGRPYAGLRISNASLLKHQQNQHPP